MSDQELADSVISQFARRLASNEKKIRDRALKQLKEYMPFRSQKSDGGFTRHGMLRIWKGLFYCMWMSDKPLVQEELSKSISSLMLEIDNTKTSMLFFDVFLQTMWREWNGIDRLRMDKFYLLVRNMLEASFKFLKSKEWDDGLVDWLVSILKNGPISPVQPYFGMHYHFCDIYLEELAKVAGGAISPDLVMKFLDPYCIFITKARNNDLVSSATTEVFEQLIENSKPALNLLAEEENDELIVEIRSHTQLPASDASPVASLVVDYSALADRIFELATAENVLAKNRKKSFILVGKFRELSEGRLPLDDIPDAVYSSEDELANMQSSLVTKMVKQDSDEFHKKKQSKTNRHNKLATNQQERAQVKSTPGNPASNEEESKVASCQLKKDKAAKSVISSTERNKKKRHAQKSSNLEKKKRRASIEAKLKALEESSTEDLPVQSQDSDYGIKKLNESLGNSVSDTTATPDNMPDLVQDVEKCTQATEPSNDRQGSPHYESLCKWLNTAQANNTHDERVLVAVELPEKPCINLSASACYANADRKENRKRKNVLAVSNKSKKSKKVACVSVSSPTHEILTISSTGTSKNRSDNENSVITIPSIKDTGAPRRSRKNSGNKSTSKVLKETRCTDDEKLSMPIDSAFVNIAASKLKKAKLQRIAALKKETKQPVKFHTPKRVAFEMSKTQIKPFRKTDKAMACSPSTTSIAFDPRKKPRCGLLKTVKSVTSFRAEAADFFD